MKKARLKVLACAVATVVGLSACSTLNQVDNQVAGLANLANCEYKLRDVSNLSVAGVNVKNLSNGKVSATDVIRLAAALTSKQVPLSMDVNINVTNPTEKSAMLTALDWIMEIDGTQFATGTNTNSYTVTPNATTAIPLSVTTDVYSLFANNGIDALKNFVQSFSNDGTSSKVALKVKPSLSVAGVTIPSPSYITLQKTTGTATK